MSLKSRKECTLIMRVRYSTATTRHEKSQIISEMVNTLQYNRKYAIQVLKRARLKSVNKRMLPLKYRASLPVILKTWQALDYICAERLHPVLLETAELLAKHREIELTEEHWPHLSSISRATLARMLKSSRQVRQVLTTWPKKASYIKS